MIRDVLLIVMLFIVPGYVGWLAFGQSFQSQAIIVGENSDQEKLTVLEILFLILLGGLVIVLWLGMLFTELNMFSLPLLMGVTWGGSALIGVWAIKNGRSLNPFRGATVQPLILLIVFFILALAVWISPKPFEYINGGRDHGLYINTGINIAKTGRILIQDEALTAVPNKSRPLLTNPATSVAPRPVPGPWSEGQRLQGLTIRDLDEGIIAPHAFHLYPVFIAIFFAVSGTNYALISTIILGLLGIISVYIVSARVFGQAVGLLTFFLLTISLAQVWYTKSPSAEILLQPLFWGGLFTFLLMLETKSGYAAILSGLSFGLMHLTKLDTVFVPIALLSFFLYRWFRHRFQLTDWVFLAVYGILILQSLLHAFFISTIYFLDQATRVLLPAPLANLIVQAANGYTYPLEILNRLISQNILLIILGLVSIGVFLWAARHFQPVISQKMAHAENNLRRIPGMLALILGCLLMGTYLVQTFITLEQLTDPWQFLTFAGWYLTPLGLLLGVIGLMYTGNLHGKHLNFVWFLLIINILPFVILGSGTFPDQFWAIRRFVPIVLPALILFASYVLWDLMPKQRTNWIHAILPLSLIGMLVIGAGQNLRPFIKFIDYKGMIDQVAQLDASFPEDAVLLFEKADAANRVTAPLWFIYDRTVFILDEDAISDPALVPAIEHWLANGRDVYWLGNGSTSPKIHDGISAQYENERLLSVLLAEGAVGRLPKNTGLFLETFDVHHIIADDSKEHRSVTTIAIGKGEDGLGSTGLYPHELLTGLTPRRWTNGIVEIELPISEQITEISLMMGNGRPPNVPAADVSVYLNDTLLDTVTVNDGNNIYNLVIPQEIDFVEETSRIRLEMEPWIPAQTGHSPDQRELGVYLDWIKLITTEPNE